MALHMTLRVAADAQVPCCIAPIRHRLLLRVICARYETGTVFRRDAAQSRKMRENHRRAGRALKIYKYLFLLNIFQEVQHGTGGI